MRPQAEAQIGAILFMHKKAHNVNI